MDVNLRLSFDGASKDNPGKAAAGVEICGGEKDILISQYLGDGITNNQAEYASLLIGLWSISNPAIVNIQIRGDSKLVVDQLNQVARVKSSSIRPLYEKVAQRLSQFKSWQIRHIPRAENVVADRLANQAIAIYEICCH